MKKPAPWKLPMTTPDTVFGISDADKVVSNLQRLMITPCLGCMPPAIDFAHDVTLAFAIACLSTHSGAW